jgi:deoxyribodipyrimidine photolyase-like uncharacterized protein
MYMRGFFCFWRNSAESRNWSLIFSAILNLKYLFWRVRTGIGRMARDVSRSIRMGYIRAANRR